MKPDWAHLIFCISQGLGSVAVALRVREMTFHWIYCIFPRLGLPEWGCLGSALRPAPKSAQERLRS